MGIEPSRKHFYHSNTKSFTSGFQIWKTYLPMQEGGGEEVILLIS
jgi:hypothetical protein